MLKAGANVILTTKGTDDKVCILSTVGSKYRILALVLIFVGLLLVFLGTMGGCNRSCEDGI